MFQKKYYFPGFSALIFTALFVILSIIYNYQEILFKPPQSLHQWRQCDCLSITMNYYQDHNAFLEPAVHNLGHDGTGKTISECPVIYYLVAMLWKLFGHQEFIYRLLVLSMFFAGLFALFKMIEDHLKDSIVSIAAVLFLFTSPTLVYYANNFLMDIPALSLAMIGLYFFFRFVRAGTDKYFYWSALFYALAGLLKISSLLSFFAIAGLFVLELIRVKFYPDRKLFKYPLKQAAVFAGVILLQFIWYSYAHNYNARYNSGNFLIGTLPVWNMSHDLVRATIQGISDHIRWDYFRRETQIAWVLIFLLVIVFFKKTDRLLVLLTLFTAAGFLAYILLFFEPLKDHDYYTVNLFILVPLVLFAFLSMLKIKFNSIYTSLLFRLILVAFLIHNIDFARRRMSDRYNPAKWQNNYYSTIIQPFGDIQPYLGSIGIEKNDRVISVSDNSINVTLYLMNHKGWTNYGTAGDSIKIRQYIAQGAKYLLIANPKFYDEPGIKPFLSHKAGQYRNIDIYRLDIPPG